MISVKKPYRGTWIFVFIFAFALGLIIRDMSTSKLTVIKSTSAVAPAPTVEMLADEEALAELININTASKAELMQLKGIGGKMAERIIDYRTEHGLFETVQDIMKVNGIGESKFEDLKDRICVTDVK